MADYNVLDYKNGEAKVGLTVTYTSQPVLGSDEIFHNDKVYVIRNVRHNPSGTPDVDLICYEKGTTNINYTVGLNGDSVCDTVPYVLSMEDPVSGESVNDYDYPIPTIWINTVSNTPFILVDVTDEDPTWVNLNGGGGGSASDITFTPAGDISSTNVQDAIEELDDEKVAKITSIDNEITRFDGVGGDVQGYTSDGPTVSDTGAIDIPSSLTVDTINDHTPGTGVTIEGLKCLSGNLIGDNNYELRDPSRARIQIDTNGTVLRSPNGLIYFQVKNDKFEFYGSSVSLIPSHNSMGLGDAIHKWASIYGVDIYATTVDATTVDATTVETDNIQCSVINNSHSFESASSMLGIMADPRLLTVMTDDPSGGTLYDYSSKGHNGTFNGTMTASDQLYKGLGYVYDLDGSNDNVSFADHNDFSFIEDTVTPTAAPFSLGMLVDIVDGTQQTLFSKWPGPALREYRFQLSSGRVLKFELCDQSIGGRPYVDSSVLSAGFHWIVGTYSGVGGNDADDGMNMYIDGVLDNNTKSGTVGTYSEMENSSTTLVLGATGGSSEYCLGDIGVAFLDASNWTAAKVWQSWLLIKGLYNL